MGAVLENWGDWNVEVGQDPEHESRRLLNTMTAEFLLRLPEGEPLEIVEGLTVVRRGCRYLLTGREELVTRTEAVHLLAEARNRDSGWLPDGKTIRGEVFV